MTSNYLTMLIVCTGVLLLVGLGVWWWVRHSKEFTVPHIDPPKEEHNALFVSMDQFSEHNHPANNARTIQALDKALKQPRSTKET